jgi:hypothetical protein
MNAAGADLEAILSRAYAEEADLYKRALAVAESLSTALERGQEHTAPLHDLLGLLDDIKRIESRIAASKGQWQSSGQKPGPALQAALGRLSELIERLAEHIQRAERTAAERLIQLTPELDAVVRGQQMRRAYQTYR